MDMESLGLRDMEYIVEVTDYTDTDQYLIMIAKMGGGTYGKKYDGAWSYVVLKNNGELARGDNFLSGTPLSHREAAIGVIQFLTDDVTDYDFQYCTERFWDGHQNMWVVI